MSFYIYENYSGMALEELESEYNRLNKKSNLILFEMRLNFLKMEQMYNIIKFRKDKERKRICRRSL